MATNQIPPELERTLNDLLTTKAKELESTVQDLRIYVKYLLFDNEALKRENKYLQKLLMGDENNEST